MNNFFITGLPRSRTAWLAAYLTDVSEYTYCYHEALNGLKSRDAFNEVMLGPAGHPDNHWLTVGNSDSGLMLTDFNTRFPDAPIVIIERNYEQVLLSLGLAGVNAYRPLLSLIKKRMDMHVGCLRVEFDQIDNRLPAICKHIGVEYDAARHALFKDLNIQRQTLTGDLDSLELWI